MRKKPTFLKNIAEPPLMRRDADAALGVEQHRPVYRKVAPLGTQQAGNRVDDGSLASPRAAKQCRQTTPDAKVNVEREIGEPMFDIDLDHQGYSPARRRPIRL